MADGYVMSKELKDAVQRLCKQYFNSFQARPKKAPVRNRHAAGSDTTNLTAFAVVTESAGASTHGPDGIAFGSAGKCILLDDDGAKSSEEDDDEIEFKSIHRLGIPAGYIIEVSAARPIKPGSVWDDNKVKGKFVDAVDELWRRPSAAAEKILFIPTGATEADDIDWYGTECE